MLSTLPNNDKENILPSETVKALEKLSLILYDIHMQMKADGYEIINGKVCKVENHHEQKPRTTQ